MVDLDSIIMFKRRIVWMFKSKIVWLFSWWIHHNFISICLHGGLFVHLLFVCLHACLMVNNHNAGLKCQEHDWKEVAEASRVIPKLEQVLRKIRKHVLEFYSEHISFWAILSPNFMEEGPLGWLEAFSWKMAMLIVWPTEKIHVLCVRPYQ